MTSPSEYTRERVRKEFPVWADDTVIELPARHRIDYRQRINAHSLAIDVASAASIIAALASLSFFLTH